MIWLLCWLAAAAVVALLGKLCNVEPLLVVAATMVLMLSMVVQVD